MTSLEELHDAAVRVLTAFDEPDPAKRRDVVWLAEDPLKTGPRRVLRIAPLSVGGLLRASLFADATVILTSATLVVGGSFDALATTWGLPVAGNQAHTESATIGEVTATGKEVPADEAPMRWRGLDAGSPFDYPRSAILYVAKHLPPPGRGGLSAQLLAELSGLMTAAHGRTLGLFSSMRAAREAAEAAARRWSNNPDAALDDFIRQLSPAALLPGKLELRTGILRLPEAARNQRIPQTIEIANRGQGPVRGEIFATAPWVRVGDGSFACPPGRTCRLDIEIDTSGLEPGRPHQAGVTLMPAGGMPEVVAVEVRVAGGGTAPLYTGRAVAAIEVSPDRIDLGRENTGSLTTREVSVTVRNRGGAPAQVRVRGAPRWLLIKPHVFRLAAGAEQVAKVRARADQARSGNHGVRPVSSIHLTLPTISSV